MTLIKLKIFTLAVFCLSATVFGQIKSPDIVPTTEPSKDLRKTNKRPAAAAAQAKAAAAEPFDKATVEAMSRQCVELLTEAGVIDVELFPERAPETVRNFLNLAATGAFDTTTFSRTVPGFIVQGGNLATREKTTAKLFERAGRIVPDEPNPIRHERGILSMARADTPNSATTNFFILVGEAAHLDGTFAAFGRVIRGMETVDAINKMPADSEKPLKPVRLKKATVAACSAPPATAKT